MWLMLHGSWKPQPTLFLIETEQHLSQVLVCPVYTLRNAVPPPGMLVANADALVAFAFVMQQL
jgi:hypothetical protein